MAKITLTADEEIQYLRELHRIQEMIPDVEIEVISEGVSSQEPYIQIDSTVGNEFRTFLKANNLKASLAERVNT